MMHIYNKPKLKQIVDHQWLRELTKKKKSTTFIIAPAVAHLETENVCLCQDRKHDEGWSTA